MAKGHAVSTDWKEARNGDQLTVAFSRVFRVKLARFQSSAGSRPAERFSLLKKSCGDSHALILFLAPSPALSHFSPGRLRPSPPKWRYLGASPRPQFFAFFSPWPSPAIAVRRPLGPSPGLRFFRLKLALFEGKKGRRTDRRKRLAGGLFWERFQFEFCYTRTECGHPQ